jgi:hypothetical protein
VADVDFQVIYNDGLLIAWCPLQHDEYLVHRDEAVDLWYIYTVSGEHLEIKVFFCSFCFMGHGGHKDISLV